MNRPDYAGASAAAFLMGWAVAGLSHAALPIAAGALLVGLLAVAAWARRH